MATTLQQRTNDDTKSFMQFTDTNICPTHSATLQRLIGSINVAQWAKVSIRNYKLQLVSSILRPNTAKTYSTSQNPRKHIKRNVTHDNTSVLFWTPPSATTYDREERF